MGSTWVLSAPGGPHVGPMNLAMRGVLFVTEYEFVCPSNHVNTRIRVLNFDVNTIH